MGVFLGLCAVFRGQPIQAPAGGCEETRAACNNPQLDTGLQIQVVQHESSCIKKDTLST